MGITYYDPYVHQRQSENMWQNLLGNMILQKISQNFREKEFTLQREQHERDQLLQLQAEGWTETPEIPTGGPTEENAQAVKATPTVSVAGKTLYAPKEPKTYDLGNGMVGYLSGGKWRIQQKAKEAAPKFVNTSRGVMRWDEDTGQLVPTGEMPHQAPRQASPYEGQDTVDVYEVDENEQYVPGSEQRIRVPKGAPYKAEGGIRIGKPPRSDNTSLIKQEVAAKSAGLNLRNRKNWTKEESQAFLNQLGKADLLTTILSGGSQGGPQAPAAPPAPGWDADKERRLRELEGGM